MNVKTRLITALKTRNISAPLAYIRAELRNSFPTEDVALECRAEVAPDGPRIIYWRASISNIDSSGNGCLLKWYTPTINAALRTNTQVLVNILDTYKQLIAITPEGHSTQRRNKVLLVDRLCAEFNARYVHVTPV